MEQFGLLFLDIGNVWAENNYPNWTEQHWKKKNHVSIIWGQEKQSQPVPLLFILILQTPNSFPSCMACFYFNVRETAEAILLWVIWMLTFKSV